MKKVNIDDLSYRESEFFITLINRYGGQCCYANSNTLKYFYEDYILNLINENYNNLTSEGKLFVLRLSICKKLKLNK